MKIFNLPILGLLAWAIIASLVFVLGVGFAGGLAEIFTPPPLAGLGQWAAVWAFILAPFLLLLLRLAETIRKRVRD